MLLLILHLLLFVSAPRGQEEERETDHFLLGLKEQEVTVNPGTAVGRAVAVVREYIPGMYPPDEPS